MLDGLIVILCCQVAGEFLVAALGLPVPGPVAGMAILLVVLVFLGSIPGAVSSAGDGLIKHLSLLFVPAGVGVMLHSKLLAREWLAISVALIVSTLACIAVTAVVMNWLVTPQRQPPASDP
jgi:holin-like protein